ncbi:hypothetical protein N9B68_01055 [bacterium]|nr:hypothetical protein [bacterium]
MLLLPVALPPSLLPAIPQIGNLASFSTGRATKANFFIFQVSHAPRYATQKDPAQSP